MQRKGLGKVRHLDTQSLWIQDALREKRLGINKVPGTENPSDAMTKFLDGTTLMKMSDKMDCHFLEGRPESAPQLAEDAAGIDHLCAPVRGSNGPVDIPDRQSQRPVAQQLQQHAAPAAACSNSSKSRASKICRLGNWNKWPSKEKVGRWSEA